MFVTMGVTPVALDATATPTAVGTATTGVLVGAVRLTAVRGFRVIRTVFDRPEVVVLPLEVAPAALAVTVAPWTVVRVVDALPFLSVVTVGCERLPAVVENPTETPARPTP